MTMHPHLPDGTADAPGCPGRQLRPSSRAPIALRYSAARTPDAPQRPVSRMGNLRGTADADGSRIRRADSPLYGRVEKQGPGLIVGLVLLYTPSILEVDKRSPPHSAWHPSSST